MRSTPKYTKARKWLLDIASNPKSSVEQLPSERDICDILQLSRQTVRKALNSLIAEGILEAKHGVGNFVNRKIVKNYQPELPKDRTIGIIIFDGKERFTLEHYIWGVLGEVINILSKKRFHIQFIYLEKQTKWSLKAKQIIAQNIVGVLWFGPPPEAKTLIDILREYDVSTIVIGIKPANKKTDYIVGDDFHGGFIAGEYLVKQGHYKILFITKAENRLFIDNRFDGFEQALFKYNLQQEDSLVFNNLTVKEVADSTSKCPLGHPVNLLLIIPHLVS